MDFEEHSMLIPGVERDASGKVRRGGSLLFMSGTRSRHRDIGLGIMSALSAALPAVAASSCSTPNET
jgi:hypothetical protein